MSTSTCINLGAILICKWSEERRKRTNEGIFARVEDEFVEVLGDGDLDVALAFGHVLALEVGLQLAVGVVLHELLEGVHRELVLHDELLALALEDAHLGLVAGDHADAELVDLLHEVVLVGDGEREAGEVLGDLHDAVAPVVGALGVLHVVHVVVGDHDVAAELLGVVHRPAKFINSLNLGNFLLLFGYRFV